MLMLSVVSNKFDEKRKTKLKVSVWISTAVTLFIISASPELIVSKHKPTVSPK